jgi:hypothetical protein
MEIGRAVRETVDLVTGWRAWTVVETADGLRLGSVLYDVLWDLNSPAIAECRHGEQVPVHPVPGPACSCGFYATRDPVDAHSYLVGRDDPATICRILGEVALWGHVLESESGWRGSHAYPLRLYVPDDRVAERLGAYEVTVSSATCELPSSRTCTAMRSRSGRRSLISRRTIRI